jgi:hypothetical protein
MIEFSDLDWEIMKAVSQEQMKQDFNALPKIYNGTLPETEGQAIIITADERMIHLDASGNLHYLD